MNVIDYMYKNFKFFFIGATCCLLTIFVATMVTKCSSDYSIAPKVSDVKIETSGKVENVSIHHEDNNVIEPKQLEGSMDIHEKSIAPKIVVWSWNGGNSIKKEQLERTIMAVLLKLPKTTADYSAVKLLMETSAVESHRGIHVTQLKDGPARGIYQMELNTISDTLTWMKKYHKDQYKAVQVFYNKKESQEWNYRHNVPWQTAMAISYYWRMCGGNDTIKNAISVNDRASLYKKVWNTHKGATTIATYHERVKLYS